MCMIKRCMIFIILSRTALCFECIKDGNLVNYGDISVMKGIKLRKQHTYLHNNSDSRLDKNGKAIKSDVMLNEISLETLMHELLNSHVLEFNLSTLFQEGAEVPRRRRQHQAFTMVLMGIVIFLMFFVTLGFQFLATFGGKAFLMAKLALLLASINGIKRIASSGVHYGLYQTGDHPALYAYERFDRPRELM